MHVNCAILRPNLILDGTFFFFWQVFSIRKFLWIRIIKFGNIIRNLKSTRENGVDNAFQCFMRCYSTVLQAQVFYRKNVDVRNLLKIKKIMVSKRSKSWKKEKFLKLFSHFIIIKILVKIIHPFVMKKKWKYWVKFKSKKRSRKWNIWWDIIRKLIQELSSRKLHHHGWTKHTGIICNQENGGKCENNFMNYRDLRKWFYTNIMPPTLDQSRKR